MNNGVPETARLEIKFVAYDIHYSTLLHWLHLHPAGFVTLHPDRWVNNVYFDTHAYGAFSENLVGASRRVKVRYRWYGKSEELEAGTLEVKCKRNCFGWKLNYKVPKAPSSSDWYTTRESLREQLPPEGVKWLDANPNPVLINRYHRKYFVSMDGKVRTTVDTQQAVWDQRFKPYPNFVHRANLPQTLVVEIKVDRQNRDLVSQVIQGLPLRVSRHSKYVTGVRMISGNWQ